MNERARALKVSLVPQHPVVPSGMSVYDYVALGRVAHHGLFHSASDGDRQIIESVLERLSLAEFRDRDVATLSGGERQRMVLARALTQSTKVVVLDEPITGLDLRHQMDMLELMKKRGPRVRTHGRRHVARPDARRDSSPTVSSCSIDGEVVLDGTAAAVIRSAELAEHYGMNLRVVDVDGADVVVPVRHEST